MFSCNVVSRWAQLVSFLNCLLDVELSRIAIYKNELHLKLKLHQLWRIASWLSQDKNNDKLTMRGFGLERLFGCLLLSATHFRKSGHARLIRGCFSFSQCFRAGVFPFLSTPPPRSLWLAPFPSLLGKFQHDAFASKLRAQRKRLHCRLVEIERFALGGAQNRPPRPLSGFDTNPRWWLIMQSARSRSYGKIGDFEQSNLSGDTYEIHWSYLLGKPKNIQVSVKLITCSMVPGSWLSRACQCSPETCKCLP